MDHNNLPNKNTTTASGKQSVKKSIHNSSFSTSENLLGYKLNTRLRALRTAKGWSQSELGTELAALLQLQHSIPTSTIASWEHKDPNLAKIPSQDKIEALAHLFKVTIDYLKGFSDDPSKSAVEYLSNQSKIENIDILPQELAQYMGQPIWVKSDHYNGWMLLTKYYELVNDQGKILSVQDIRKDNASFSVFPPCHVYFKQIYNRFVIPENQIRNYRERMWVCINSPDPSLQLYNGWYTKTPDGLGVKGKTMLSYDTYFDFWLAYTTPLSD